MPARTLALPALLACALLCLLASPALAGRSQEMILQDDPKLVYPASDEALDESLRTIKALGTDRVRVTLLWLLVAPNPRSERRPDFGPAGAGDPRSYPPGSWRRYDRLVQLAQRHGLGVLFTPSGPGPAWADRGRRRRPGITRPDARAFGDFVLAAGRRYSGAWPEDDASFGVATRALPRVDHWSLWNEPNFPSWLMPQWSRGRPSSPHTYRRLVDEGWRGLRDSGHAEDTVLLGETAPFGQSRRKRLTSRSLINPLRFVRELYCLSERYRPLRGRAARARGCPRTAAGRRRFRSDHPGLFASQGWAHHPYSLTRTPTWPGRSRDDVPLGGIGRLGRALDRSRRAWRNFGRPLLWITEYGYQTRPDPYRAVSFARQAAWMSWAEYETFRRGRVASFAQFLLDDDAPDPRFSVNTPRAWITWQSGLRNSSGEVKPAFAEYQHPIFVSPTRRPRGRRVRVFAAYRPGAAFAEIPARIEFRGARGGWSPLAAARGRGARGYLLARVRVPRTGRVRVVFETERGEVATRGVFVRTR